MGILCEGNIFYKPNLEAQPNLSKIKTDQK